jgi:hypothetical protein
MHGLGHSVTILVVNLRPIVISQGVVTYLLGQHLPVGVRKCHDGPQVACSACVVGLVPGLHYNELHQLLDLGVHIEPAMACRLGVARLQGDLDHILAQPGTLHFAHEQRADPVFQIPPIGELTGGGPLMQEGAASRGRAGYLVLDLAGILTRILTTIPAKRLHGRFLAK